MCKEHLKVENNAKGKQDRNSKLRYLNTLEITRNQLQILDYKQKLPNPQEKVHAEVWVGVWYICASLSLIFCSGRKRT